MTSAEMTQVNIRIPAALKTRLDEAAKEDDRTFSNVCAYGLRMYIQERDAILMLKDMMRLARPPA